MSVESFLGKVTALANMYTDIRTDSWFELYNLNEKASWSVKYLHKSKRLFYKETLRELTLLCKELNFIGIEERQSILDTLLIKAVDNCLERKDIEQIFVDARQSKSKKYTLFKPIWGLSNVERWEMGKIKILDLKQFKNVLNKDCQTGPQILYSIQNFLNSPNYELTHFIGYTNTTRSNERLKEIALSDIEIFENILRFIGGPFTFSYCSSTNRQPPRGWGDLFIGEIDSSFQAEGNIPRRPFDFKALLNIGEDLRPLVDFASGTRKTNSYQQRILNAASMIGSAMSENNYSNGFLKCVIALESLFTPSKNDLISPSINEQISLALSYILHSDLTLRQLQYKEMKSIYNLRSKIVHTGYGSVLEDDYYSILDMTHSVIKILISKNPFTTFKSYDNLNDWIRTQKLS